MVIILALKSLFQIKLVRLNNLNKLGIYPENRDNSFFLAEI